MACNGHSDRREAAALGLRLGVWPRASRNSLITVTAFMDGYYVPDTGFNASYIFTYLIPRQSNKIAAPFLWVRKRGENG